MLNSHLFKLKIVYSFMKKRLLRKAKNFIKKNFLAVKIIISAVLGFLPSFLFILFFIQAGSPLLNFIKFLSDLNSSAGAWISAIIISSFAYFLLGFIKSGKTFKKIIANRPLLITLIIFFILIFILISAQLYLYANFALRNDILVELTADKENIFFTDNPEENIIFKVDLIMNPFCSAQCEYEFSDVSYGGDIDRGSFNITSIPTKSKKYEIKNNNLVDGSQELKRFEIACKSKRTLLCYTREEESRRAVLLTINYQLSEEEKIFKNDSRDEIINSLGIFYLSNGKLKESTENIASINNSFYAGDFSAQAEILQNGSENISASLINLKDLWESQNFDILKKELSETKNRIENLENNSEELALNIISNISLYNVLIENLSSSKNILEQLSANLMTSSICGKLNEVISDYNKALLNFKGEPLLQNKKIIAENITKKINALYEEYQNADGGFACSISEKINPENLGKINIFSENLPPETFPLNEPEPVCCLDGSCGKCCDKKCSDKNYPVIFLHGQSINEAIPVGYSLDTFSKVKKRLVSEGYIDAGSIVLGPAAESGLWGKINSTLIMTGSYFFDTYKTATGEKTFSSNKEGIDTYAIRLRNLIDLVKYRTNKEKVIIVAHSMGGVVTRRYIQIFGGDSVEKAILVTAPNHGVDDKTRDVCALIGPEVSCSELDENSIFMDQLNNAETEKIPVYNIIGIGCDMGDETGDGVIKNSSQYLENAVNYYFKGACNELNFEFFHEQIIFPERYPEVYNKIYEMLKNSNLQL